MNQIYVLLCGVLWRFLRKRIGLWYTHGAVGLSLRLATYLTHDVFTATPESFRISTPKCHVLGHGIDLDLFTPPLVVPPRVPFTALSVGRISPVKDYETMIVATHLARDQGVPLSVRIVGSPGAPEQEVYLERLQKLVRERNLGEHILLSGASLHKDLPKHLQGAHVFIHASLHGSLDKAPLEAMATGVPVVSCNESVVSVFPSNIRLPLSFEKGNARSLSEKLAGIFALPEEEYLRLRNISRTTATAHDVSVLIETVIALLSRRTEI